LLEKIEQANRVPVVIDGKGILHKIDTSPLLVLVKRRRKSISASEVSLLDKNTEFAGKVHDNVKKESENARPIVIATR
jgi:hypothetical protein